MWHSATTHCTLSVTSCSTWFELSTWDGLTDGTLVTQAVRVIKAQIQAMQTLSFPLQLRKRYLGSLQGWFLDVCLYLLCFIWSLQVWKTGSSHSQNPVHQGKNTVFSGGLEWTVSLPTGSGLIVWNKWLWSILATEVHGWLPFFLLPEASLGVRVCMYVCARTRVCVCSVQQPSGIYNGEMAVDTNPWSGGDARTLAVAVHSCHFPVLNIKNPKKQMDSIEHSFIFQKIGFVGVWGDSSLDKVLAVEEWRPEAGRTHMQAWQLWWLPVIQHSEERSRGSLEKAG